MPEPNDTTGTGGAGEQTGAGATGQQPNGTAAAATATTQQTTQQTSSQQTGQPGSTTEFRYKEDRSDWVPRHRLNEASGKTREHETTIQDLQRKLTIALGGNPTDANTEKAEAVKEAFFKLPGMGIFRKLSQLQEDQLDSLLQVPQQVNATRDAEARQWQRHGAQQVDVIAEKVADALGSEKLDDDQKGDLRDSFSSWLGQKVRAELQQAADRYGEEAVSKDQRRFSATIRSYEDGDAKLLDEFTTRYLKNWVEPARRTQTARTSTRTRPVPDSSGRSHVTSVTKPEKFKTLDERLDYGVALLKERGVQFGR